MILPTNIEMENFLRSGRKKKKLERKFSRDVLPLRLNSINVYATDTKDLPELLPLSINAAACGINLPAKRTE